MSFGKVIKRKRVEKDYTLDKMAELTGIDRANISNYENEKLDNPKLSTVRSFATALGIDIVIPADENEPIRSKDAFKDIDLQGSAYDKETEAFIKTPEAQPYIILSRLIFIYGIDSPAVKVYIDTLKTFPKNKS